MSEFNSWRDIGSWIQERIYSDSGETVIKMPHPKSKNFYLRAVFLSDYPKLELKLFRVLIGNEQDKILCCIVFNDFINILEAFCPDPTTVTVVKDGGGDE